MNNQFTTYVAATIAVIGLVVLFIMPDGSADIAVPADRKEVVFWHFWGGADREVVEEVVRRFNESQSEHFVRAVPMPGNNLDLKFYLAVTGGKPPDLLNIDDPVIADWGHRGAIMPLDEVASVEEVDELRKWLFPAAARLATYQDRLYALPNGLDIRALYYNQTLLDQYDLQPPQTIEELDHIAETIAPSSSNQSHQHFGYLPDSRRLWAWGVVFGGKFYDDDTNTVTLADPGVERAMQWMIGYRKRYGADQIARFRKGDQSLPGKPFPLLANRYALVMDGQWRVRDIRAFQKQQQAAGKPVTQFGVCPLPAPVDGRKNAGWVNGNNFVVPQGATNSDGAWQFMKFWCGFDGNEKEAATTAVRGGWIPVSAQVAAQPEFQAYLKQEPMFAQFVELAGSENQFPVPVVPGAGIYNNEVKSMTEAAMLSAAEMNVKEELKKRGQLIQQRLDQARSEVAR